VEISRTIRISQFLRCSKTLSVARTILFVLCIGTVSLVVMRPMKTMCSFKQLQETVPVVTKARANCEDELVSSSSSFIQYIRMCIKTVGSRSIKLRAVFAGAWAWCM
jgi:hypothetical protein